jgi:predicted small secreted protein
MKKVSILFTVFAACSLFLISWKTASNTEGAVHINDFGCGVFDGNGNIVLVTGDVVITPSGKTNFKCKGSGVPNSTGSAVIWNFENKGVLCNTFSGATEDWQEVVSTSGNVTLICKVH